MRLLAVLGQLLLSEWIWSVTWGAYHVPLNIVLMIFLFKFFTRISIVPAVLIAFFSQLFSFIIYWVLIVGGLIFFAHIEYIPEVNSAYVPNSLSACLSLGFVYTVLQVFFFYLLNMRYQFNVRWAIAASFVSNTITALLVYQLFSLSS